MMLYPKAMKSSAEIARILQVTWVVGGACQKMVQLKMENFAKDSEPKSACSKEAKTMKREGEAQHA